MSVALRFGEEYECEEYSDGLVADGDVAVVTADTESESEGESWLSVGLFQTIRRFGERRGR